MKEIGRLGKRKSLLCSVISKYILTKENQLMIKGGVAVGCAGAGETLKASDYPNADDYLCTEGATLKPKISLNSGINSENTIS
jgi:hypothetical protein